MKKLILMTILLLGTFYNPSMAKENGTVNIKYLLKEVRKVENKEHPFRVDVSDIVKKYISMESSKNSIIQPFKDKKFKVYEREETNSLTKNWDEAWIIERDIDRWYHFASKTELSITLFFKDDKLLNLHAVVKTTYL